ncbi:two-component response regulator-like PRR73 [Malania oleifera]|uniref:two-component response regulator-like PRR73 n=1 Tax=Malania oleifera TaxID=397392 RepID=UPI0025AE1B00|nr:two-component response regulator-like PRR73 [Malania oleifera]XP_057956347.1 two-component response regulator-like PRR73 [Malania oleifera]XP_057956349.1 two-component response regulator-like PRR73 [Malania oleifera]XP_057956350.1 two-component response regulator-like PRR73 [Malania oleifera]
METGPHGAGNGGLVEQNNLMWDERKLDSNGVVDEGQCLGSSEEDECRIKNVAEDVNNGPEGMIQVHDGLQRPQQQPQGPVIRWERFLPVGTLKVLLVENDDSTRHVVSALLRNCSYEVTAVANGLQAWNILENLTNHIDLVLTEVVMPFLTGIGLLCKIMSHKTLNNIPVIMMSSHDSMGIVFKCLSKGAVDFLAKPIRKNELKNLWQHVWRRCHSSSGSGSESGTQTKKYAKSNSNEESENNTGSSDERDNGSIGLSNRNGSDNGSGTQSSWTKRAAETDSPQPLSPWDQLADAPDSTCAQVIHTKPETVSDTWVHITETKEYREQDEEQDHAAMGKHLEIGVSRNADLPLDHRDEKFPVQSRSKRQNKLPDLETKPFDKGQLEHGTENMSGKMREQAANLMNPIVNCTNPLVHSRATEAPTGISDISQNNDKVSCNSRELPSLELSLRRLRGAIDAGTATHDVRNVLRHSDLSAFSKYNNASSSNQAPTGNVGSCSPLDNSSVAMKAESMHNFASNSSGTPANQQSHGSSNNDMASTTKQAILRSDAINEKSESISAFRYFHSPTFQPVQNGQVCQAPQVLPGKADDLAVDTVQDESRGSHLHVQVQHHHHHYHHYHHHVHNMQQQQSQPDHDDRSLKNMAAAAPQCGSSNVFGGPIEGNAGNCSMNGSASGSNHGSNGQNGSSTALNAGVTNIESDNGAAANSGAGGISGNGLDEDRCAQREAALTKFRQKRKERCFEKKVRYQSRKRLAEQRPRIRGQFVRQIACDGKAAKDKDEQSSGAVSGDNSCDR